MYRIRRQKNLKVTGNNENFLKKAGKGTIQIPKKYQDQFPHHGIRIALRYPTGWYQGMIQPMVSLYLFNKITGERSLLETLVLAPYVYSRNEQVLPLSRKYYEPNYDVKEIKKSILSYDIEDILKDYKIKL